MQRAAERPAFDSLDNFRRDGEGFAHSCGFAWCPSQSREDVSFGLPWLHPASHRRWLRISPRALRQGTLTGGSAVACKSKYVTTVRPRLSDFTTPIDTFTRISFLGSTLTPTVSPPVESGIRTL